MTRYLMLLPMLAIACGGTEPLPPEPATIVFTPDAVIADAADAWATRWRDATGKSIQIGSNGIPVQALEDLTLLDGDHDCGATLVRTERQTGRHLRTDLIEISVPPPSRCVAASESVGHEMGHALGGLHSSGILAEKLRRNRAHKIDAGALESVCAELECLWMAPEL